MILSEKAANRAPLYSPGSARNKLSHVRESCGKTWETEKVDDAPLRVVTIMNYPREPRYLRMCYIFLDSVIAHGARNITVLYEDHPPVVAPEHRQMADIEVVKGQ